MGIKGQIPWNKGTKGLTKGWNKGKTHASDPRIARPWLGKKRDPEMIERMRNTQKDSPLMRGENHYMWKGEDVGYRALHHWIIRMYGKATKCENESCFYPRFSKRGVWMEKPMRYEWANISGKYRRHRDDYKQMCPSCHRMYDSNPEPTELTPIPVELP